MEDVDLSGVKETVKEVVGTEATSAAKDIFQQISEVLDKPVVKLAVTVLLCLLVIRILLKLVDKSVGRMKIETTAAKFIRSVLRVAVYVVVILVGAGTLGFEISSLVALVSVFSAALALAAQDVLGNFFGGILLMITKPFLVGDYVAAGSSEGTVAEVQLLNTILKTADNRVVTIPNGTISTATITNYSRGGTRRLELDFTVGYDAPIEQVEEIMMRVMTDHPASLNEPEPIFARITAFGTNSVTYSARVWCKADDYWPLRYDLLEGIKRQLDAAGIACPYQQTDVRLVQK